MILSRICRAVVLALLACVWLGVGVASAAPAAYNSDGATKFAVGTKSGVVGSTTPAADARVNAARGEAGRAGGMRSLTASSDSFLAAKVGARSSFEALSQSAAASYKGQEMSVAGRALQKHGGRPGSAFPGATGSPQAINRQASIVDDVLQNPARTRTSFYNPRLDQCVVDIRIPGGRGIRYGESGDFRGFLEPPR